MKFPWQHRADKEAKHRAEAEERLIQALDDWGDIGRVAASLRRDYDLNGWNARVAAVFAVPSAHRGRHGDT